MLKIEKYDDLGQGIGRIDIIKYALLKEQFLKK